MPVHDWSRVPHGTFHHFHVTWIPMLSNVLNGGVLPAGYYAMAEQVAGVIPDVLALQAIGNGHDQEAWTDSGNGGTALLTTPPKATVTAVLEEELIYAARANRLAIRHQSDDRVVAFLEVVSPGNKASERAIEQFVEKAINALWEGIHLLIIDLVPPSVRDPEGLHGLIWRQLGAKKEYRRPPDKALTLAAYSAFTTDEPVRAFVEPLAAGDALPSMPLFLAPGQYVQVPLEASYMSAVSQVPARARKPLED
jgi:hypothetical protein